MRSQAVVRPMLKSCVSRPNRELRGLVSGDEVSGSACVRACMHVCASVGVHASVHVSVS